MDKGQIHFEQFSTYRPQVNRENQIEAWHKRENEPSLFLFDIAAKVSTEDIRNQVDSAYKEIDQPAPSLIIVTDFRPVDKEDIAIEPIYINNNGRLEVIALFDSKNRVLILDHHKGDGENFRFYGGLDPSDLGRPSSTPIALAFFNALENGELCNVDGSPNQRFMQEIGDLLKGQDQATVANHADQDTSLALYLIHHYFNNGKGSLRLPLFRQLADTATDADHDGRFAQVYLGGKNLDNKWHILSALISAIEKERNLVLNLNIIRSFIENPTFYTQLLATFLAQPPSDAVIKSGTLEGFINSQFIIHSEVARRTARSVLEAKQHPGTESVYTMMPDGKITTASAFTWLRELLQSQGIRGAVSLIVCRNRTSEFKIAGEEVPLEYQLRSVDGHVVDGMGVVNLWIRSNEEIIRHYLAALAFFFGILGRFADNSFAAAGTRSGMIMLGGVPMIYKGDLDPSAARLEILPTRGIPIRNKKELNRVIKRLAMLLDGKWDQVALGDYLGLGDNYYIERVKTHHYGDNFAGLVRNKRTNAVKSFFKCSNHPTSEFITVEYLEEILRQEALSAAFGSVLNIPKIKNSHS